MPRPAKISAASRTWKETRDECRSLFAMAKPLAVRGVRTSAATGFKGAPARQVVGLAFLRLVGAWELFLEDVFLRYMVGATTSTGAVVVQSKAPTIDDAFQRLLLDRGDSGTRTTKYLGWTNWKEIRDRAKTHFVTGDPFRATLTGPPKKVVDMAHKIRHRVAHPSTKARTVFNGIAVSMGAGNTLGKLPTGFMVGDLLLRAPNSVMPVSYRSVATIFEAYLKLFEDLSSGLTP